MKVVRVAFTFWDPFSLSAILCLILLIGSLFSDLFPLKVTGGAWATGFSTFFSAGAEGGACLGASFLTSWAGACWGGACCCCGTSVLGADATSPAAEVSTSTKLAPTSSFSPSLTKYLEIFPAKDDLILTVSFSVSTTAISSSSLTISPTSDHKD